MAHRMIKPKTLRKLHSFHLLINMFRYIVNLTKKGVINIKVDKKFIRTE